MKTMNPITPRGEPLAATARATLIIGGFFLGSIAWGGLARGWMRLVSADPEFTWSGTLFIVTTFTIAGTAQGIALAVRQRRWRRWAQNMVRGIAALLVLPLGAGAGIVMLPTIVAGSLALARTDWRRGWRLALGAVAVLNTAAMILLLHEGLTWTRTVIGWLAMIPIYAVILWAISLNLRPLGDGWRMPFRGWVVFAALAALAAIYRLVLVVGF